MQDYLEKTQFCVYIQGMTFCQKPSKNRFFSEEYKKSNQ